MKNVENIADTMLPQKVNGVVVGVKYFGENDDLVYDGRLDIEIGKDI